MTEEFLLKYHIHPILGTIRCYGVFMLDDIKNALRHREHAAIIITPDYRIVFANEAYRKRYKSDVRLGQDTCYSISHHYDSPCHLNHEDCPMQRCLKDKQKHQITHLHFTTEGREYCDILMTPIVDESNQIVAYVEEIMPNQMGSTQDTKTGLVGQSHAFTQMLDQLKRVAPSDLPVLLRGETGTGKELSARAIHQHSHVSDGPFVPVECVGLSDQLFESELFGYEKGAFTGAHTSRQGLIASAAGGTLFLDEIGDVPLHMQVKLLRLLESRTYRKVGGRAEHQAKFRLICATNRDLEALIANGEFRADLYYRINVFPIRLPALRERTGDISLLAEHFLRQVAPSKHLSQKAKEWLSRQPFLGNIRELKNHLLRAALLSSDETVQIEHLEMPTFTQSSSTESENTFTIDNVDELDRVMTDYVHWAHTQNPDKESLATQLGLSVRSLYRYLSRSRS